MKSKATFLLLFILNTSFAQSPTKELTNDEKIYGLSKLWSEVNRNFANFDLTQINWDSTYQSFIPKVMATKNDGDYYKELMRMMALIKDGHSNVYYNPFFVYKSLPLKTKLIEDKIIVIEVNNDTLIMKNKIEIGDEIIEINKKNALDYAKNEIMPFQSASTVQDLNVRTFTYALLTGKPDELVELKIKKIDNIILNTTISRKLISNFKRQTYELKITDNNVAHLVVNDFQNDSYQKIFDSLFVKIVLSK